MKVERRSAAQQGVECEGGKRSRREEQGESSPRDQREQEQRLRAPAEKLWAGVADAHGADPGRAKQLDVVPCEADAPRQRRVPPFIISRDQPGNESTAIPFLPLAPRGACLTMR